MARNKEAASMTVCSAPAAEEAADIAKLVGELDAMLSRLRLGGDP
jgi:hypothetical protein